jgi:putative copper resistance protein D
MDNFLYLPRSLAALLFDLPFAAAFGAILALLWLRQAPQITARHAARRILSASALTMLLAIPAQLWLLTATMIGSSSAADIRQQILDVLTATHAGRILIPDFACVLLLLILSLSRRITVYLALAFAVMLAAFRSASGHAASNGNFSGTEILQFLHLTSIAIWAGSILLAGFVVLPRLAGLEEQTQFSRRLSHTATIAILVVALSGIYNAWAGLGSPHNLDGSLTPLAHTQWGILLLIKSALVLVALALGANNRLILHRNPILLAPDAARLALSMRLEAVAMATILILSGFLANSPPATGM